MPKVNSFLMVLGFLGLILTSPSVSQPLWSEARKGMTTQDVLNAVQGAQLNESGGRLASGATARVFIPDFTIVNNSFEVRFYFLREALVQVTLHLNGDRPYGHAKVVFDSLVQVLRAKYGNEITYKERHNDRAIASWMTKDRVNVDLYLASLGDTKSVLNLNYQSRVSEEMEKI